MGDFPETPSVDNSIGNTIQKFVKQKINTCTFWFAGDESKDGINIRLETNIYLNHTETCSYLTTTG